MLNRFKVDAFVTGLGCIVASVRLEPFLTQCAASDARAQVGVTFALHYVMFPSVVPPEALEGEQGILERQCTLRNLGSIPCEHKSDTMCFVFYMVVRQHLAWLPRPLTPAFCSLSRYTTMHWTIDYPKALRV